MGILKKFTTDRKNKSSKEEVLEAEKKVPAKKAVEKKNTEEKSSAKKVMTSGSNAYKILIRPYISEKAAVAEARGTYTFEVASNTNKFEIKKAIQEIYGVMPKKVRLMNFEGRRVRFGNRFGRRKDWKKAVAVLPKGKTINIHEGV